MKFTKFIPLALALALVSPAFAANSYDGTPATPSGGPVNETLQFTIESYFHMQEASYAVKTSNDVTIGNNYTELTLGTPLKFGFDVTTNTATNDYVDLSASANGVSALGGTSAAPILAFYNSSKASTVTSTQVAAALAGTGGVASKNVIAFNVTPKVTVVADSGGSVTPADIDSGVIKYTLTNGKYQFYYDVSAGAINTTFDTNDQAGIYQTIVTLTKSAAM